MTLGRMSPLTKSITLGHIAPYTDRITLSRLPLFTRSMTLGRLSPFTEMQRPLFVLTIFKIKGNKLVATYFDSPMDVS